MWKPTNTPNLLRNENGRYYARVVHLRRQHWKSLETSTFAVAKKRLPKAEEEIRGKAVAAGGALTFEQAAVVYAASVAGERLGPKTREFRLRFEKTLRRTWPDLWVRDVRRVTGLECKAWQTRFENGGAAYFSPGAKIPLRADSATTVNGCIGYLRRVFDVATERGLIAKNPAAALSRKPVTNKLIELPSRAQFLAMVEHVRQIPVRWANDSADLIEGLAYSGMRVEEASSLKWTDVSLETGLLVVRGTKTADSARIVPMTGAMRELLGRLDRKGSAVFSVRKARGCLASASRAVGVKKQTHHDLRHLFATTCIESGVDIPTVSRWLGHSDGGSLAMKTYGHLRPAHSLEAAAKVRFTS
jgi:integrase